MGARGRQTARPADAHRVVWAPTMTRSGHSGMPALRSYAVGPGSRELNPQSGKCLTDTNSGASGTQASIDDCTGQSNQLWTLP